MNDKKKIAMVVYNSVSHDARVLKEAETLALSGYCVRIFGIKDNNNSKSFEQLGRGIEICRVNWRTGQYEFLSLLTLLITVVFLCLMGVFFWLFVYHYSISYSISELISLLFSRGVLNYLVYECNAITLFYILLSMFILIYGVRLAVQFSIFSQNYFRLFSEDKLSASAEKKSSRFSLLLFVDAAFRSIENLSIKRVLRLFSSIGKRVISVIVIQKYILPEIVGYKPSVIHCHDLITVPLGAKLKSSYGIVLVYDSHEIYEEQGSYGLILKVIFYLLQKKYSRHVDRFITINESIGDFLTNRYRKLPKPVIIKNATKKINEKVNYDGRLHRAAEIDPNVKILLYQGGFGPKRGLETLVESAPLLPDEWCLVMMGWGSLEDRLKDMAMRLDPNRKKIRFVERAPHAELVHWTAGASVGIIPYENVNLNHWYCTPNKLWEYPNAGVPLLVSPFPEMKKMVLDNKIGWLLDLELSSENIAETIASISDKEIRNASVACFDFIQRDNWSFYEERLVNLYESVV